MQKPNTKKNSFDFTEFEPVSAVNTDSRTCEFFVFVTDGFIKGHFLSSAHLMKFLFYFNSNFPLNTYACRPS